MSCALRIGLTGGIGSGKSETSHYFSSLGVPVIDTDRIARELVEPGKPALAEIVDTFGEQMLDAQGRLDRARLRAEVFSDANRRKTLESILHPRIRQRVIDRLQETDASYCIVVIPLLLESARDYPIDRILVVDCPLELQFQRAAQRDGRSQQEIASIAATQVAREKRLRVADDVLRNDGSLEELHEQIERLHGFYLDLVARGDRGPTPPP